MSQPITSTPVVSPAEAEQLMAHFVAVMDKLIAIVKQETELVRAGHVGKAAELEAAKSELARSYVADTLRLKASQPRLARLVPADRLGALRKRHDSFRSLLQINSTVLATAHAVSEGIVRGVSGEMARKSAPQTYGVTGRANMPSRNAAAPLAVSRML
jgi:hypothetical protein